MRQNADTRRGAGHWIIGSCLFALSHAVSSLAIGAPTEGTISFYGKSFHGKKTACGGHFDQHAFTMAHRQLRCGTYVLVTNLRNKRSVMVRVTDHGPNVKGRIADVSYAAAQSLGMLRRGLTRARLEVQMPPAKPVDATAKPTE